MGVETKMLGFEWRRRTRFGLIVMAKVGLWSLEDGGGTKAEVGRRQKEKERECAILIDELWARGKYAV